MSWSTTVDVPLILVLEPGWYTIKQDENGYLSWERCEVYPAPCVGVHIDRGGSVSVYYSDPRKVDDYGVAPVSICIGEQDYREMFIRLSLGLATVPLFLRILVWESDSKDSMQISPEHKEKLENEEQISEEVRQKARELADAFLESLNDPERRAEAEEFHRRISRISAEDLFRRFTI